MAFFIASLALSAELLDAAKVGILAGSVLSAVAGMSLLVALIPKHQTPNTNYKGRTIPGSAFDYF